MSESPVLDCSDANFLHFRWRERVAERQQPVGHVCHVFPPRQDGGDLAVAALQPDGLDEVGEDGDEVDDFAGHVASRGLVVHDVQNAEGVEDDGEAVVVDHEEAILVAVDQNLEHLKKMSPSSIKKLFQLQSNF